VNVSTLQNPRTAWTTQGRSVSLSCRTATSNPVRWFYIKSQNEPQYVIFNGISVELNYKDKVTMDRDPAVGKWDMTVKNVQLNESGWYICIDDEGSGSHRHGVEANLLSVRG